MIKTVTFSNFRNLNGKYDLQEDLNIVFGPNNSGKTNFIEGLKLAFSMLDNDIYFKVSQSDFLDSDDTKVIEIKVELFDGSIPSLEINEEAGIKKCGFIVRVNKTSSGRYRKSILYLNYKNFDTELVKEDDKLPVFTFLPLIRVEDIYSNGLMTEVDKFINSDKYKELCDELTKQIDNSIKEKVNQFREFCKEFDSSLRINFNNPSLSKEKAYLTDGEKEHNLNIGAGYKSIANIFLNLFEGKRTIIFVDEIENHLHPSLLRMLLRKVESLSDVQFIGTTHSPIVINEVGIDKLIDVKCCSLANLLNDTTKEKLNFFLTTGRAEMIFSEKFILVEGYTEKLLFDTYAKHKGLNWSVINVAGIMFEPYIELAKVLNKQGIVISDTDFIQDENDEPSSRYKKLEEICKDNGYKLIGTYNTLESDLYKNGLLSDCTDLLKKVENKDVYVAKPKKKTEIVAKLLESKDKLDEWDIIKEINNEF